MSSLPTLGPYRVEAKLGEGGMAEIFLARMPGSGPVVLKRLLPEYKGDREFLDMFRDEARISSSLAHPNILKVFEIGETDGLPWLVMEYLNGPTASQLVKQQKTAGTFDFERGARVIEMVARALHYAHTAADKEGKPLHLVHRDVSPSNIMVSSQDGATKLLDFGVARADGRSTRTKTGVMKGKTAFMSPEQVNGEKLDGRTDIFAAGVCLYALTTGHLPFTADSELKILNKIAAGDLTPPRFVLPGYPRALEGIVLRALATDRNSRYKTGEELADALKEFAPPPRAGVPADTARWLRSLFPNWDAEQARRISEGRRMSSASLTGLTPVSDKAAEPPHGPPPPARRPDAVSDASMTRPGLSRPWGLAGVGVAGLVALSGGLWWSNHAPLSPATPQGAVLDAGASGDDLSILLKMAERLRSEGKSEESTVVMRQALAMPAGTPAQVAQLKGLRVDLGLLAAEHLVLDGKPQDAARELEGVLAVDANNADAQELLTTVRASLADAGAAKGPTGKVVVESTPSAEVFLEDVSQGTTPVELSLAPGPHKLVLKRAGYQPFSEVVRATVRKTVRVKAALTRGPGRDAPPPPPAP